jgi:hypothetical protein
MGLTSKDATIGESTSATDSTITNENTPTQTNQPMGAAILALISGVVQGVGSVWTSSNNVKAQRLEIAQTEAESKNAGTIALREAALKSLDIKKQALANQVAKDKADANVKGITTIVVAATLSFIAFLLLRKPQTPKRS